MNIKNIDKEQLKDYGKVGLRIGKRIVIEGTKAVAIQAATRVIEVSFNDGFDGVKELTLDDYIGDKKKKKDKSGKKLFSKKKNKKVDEAIDVVVEEVEIIIEDEIVDDKKD